MPPGHDNPQTGPSGSKARSPATHSPSTSSPSTPARSYGVSSFSPGFGALVGTDRPRCSAPTTRRRPGATTSTPSATSPAPSPPTASSPGSPLAPFLGCLGVAPAGGEVRTPSPPGLRRQHGLLGSPRRQHGLLGVNMPGGLLSFGDGHYEMGEGEIMGAAVEGAMNVEVVVDLIEGKHASDPPHREQG